MLMLTLVKSFFLGVVAVCGLGPIFILTLNRSTKYGLSHGIMTAFGACVGDGLLFFLGLVGVLNILENSHRLLILTHFMGGLLVFMLGFKMFDYEPSMKIDFYESRSLIKYWVKPFFLTIFNPAALIFFMAASMQFVPRESHALSFNLIISASCALAVGSFVTLSLIAYGAYRMGAHVDRKYLKNIAYVSGMFLVAVGIYFMGDSILVLLAMY